MTSPELLKVGQRYPGALPEQDCALFEFSKAGPELRLFFAEVPDRMVTAVAGDEVWIGVLREGDLGIVPWRIGEHMQGDAQFHIFLYLPETRPTDQILSAHHRYALQILLVDRRSAEIRVVRTVLLSPALSRAFNEIVAHQLGNHIGREEYDAQVSIYQNRFPDLDTVIAAARFERADSLETP